MKWTCYRDNNNSLKLPPLAHFMCVFIEVSHAPFRIRSQCTKKNGCTDMPDHFAHHNLIGIFDVCMYVFDQFILYVCLQPKPNLHSG